MDEHNFKAAFAVFTWAVQQAYDQGDCGKHDDIEKVRGLAFDVVVEQLQKMKRADPPAEDFDPSASPAVQGVMVRGVEAIYHTAPDGEFRAECGVDVGVRG
jgi:hypothetical protein